MMWVFQDIVLVYVTEIKQKSPRAWCFHDATQLVQSADPVHFDDEGYSMPVVSQHPCYLFCSVMHFVTIVA